jgi:hypothetical protein
MFLFCTFLLVRFMRDVMHRTEFRGLGGLTDMGVHLRGTVFSEGSVGYSLTVGNGNAQIPENNKYKKFYAALNNCKRNKTRFLPIMLHWASLCSHGIAYPIMGKCTGGLTITMTNIWINTFININSVGKTKNADVVPRITFFILFN